MPMLKQLRRDHANMARILHVLQLKQKTLAQGERPNFQLVREVVDYILDYMAGFDDVWICRRADIARHWIEEHPCATL